MQERPSKHAKEVRYAKWIGADGREVELRYDRPVSLWKVLKDAHKKLRTSRE